MTETGLPEWMLWRLLRAFSPNSKVLQKAKGMASLKSLKGKSEGITAENPAAVPVPKKKLKMTPPKNTTGSSRRLKTSKRRSGYWMKPPLPLTLPSPRKTKPSQTRSAKSPKKSNYSRKHTKNTCAKRIPSACRTATNNWCKTVLRV